MIGASGSNEYYCLNLSSLIMAFRWIFLLMVPLALLSGAVIFFMTSPFPPQTEDSLLKAPIFVKKWGGSGTSPGQFDEASSIELSSNGDVYVAGHEDRVQVFDYQGNLKLIFGSSGSADGKFQHPHGLAMDRTTNTLFVGDQENHRIQVFNAQGQFINKIANSDLVHIHDIGIDPNEGLIYAPDYEDDHLQKINPSTGEVVWKKTGLPGGWGVSVDSRGYVYLALTNAGELHKIDPTTGQTIKEIGGFSGAQGITGVYVDSHDLVYAVDAPTKEVRIYDTDLVLLATWDLREIVGPISIPEDITISDDDGNIYIADSVSNFVFWLKRE